MGRTSLCGGEELPLGLGALPLLLGVSWVCVQESVEGVGKLWEESKVLKLTSEAASLPTALNSDELRFMYPFIQFTLVPPECRALSLALGIHP